MFLVPLLYFEHLPLQRSLHGPVWEDNRRWNFSPEDTLLWIRILARSDSLKLKCLDEFVYYRSMQLFTSQDMNWCNWVVLITCGLLWCFYQLFELSFWWHPFTTDDPLVSKWCNATFLQTCSDEKTNSSTYWMAWGWVHLQANFNFWVNYSCNVLWTILCACSRFFLIRCLTFQNCLCFWTDRRSFCYTGTRLL